MAPPGKKAKTKNIKLSGNSQANPGRYSNRRQAAPEYGIGDLDNVLRNRRNTAKQAREPRPHSPEPREPVKEVEPSRLDQLSDSVLTDESVNEDISTVLQDVPPEAYPWGDEVLALIGAIVADQNLAQTILMSEKNRAEGLRNDRNINLESSTVSDPYADEIKKLPSKLEKDEGDHHHEYETTLWEKDLKNCSESNEALFQRTALIAMLDRYRLFYHDGTANRNRYAFSAETVWICPPMPSNGYRRGSPPLARPKPDLCVSFRTNELIPPAWQTAMPLATMNLARFEGPMTWKRDRAFPFLSIEAKATYTYPEDPRALHQILNCASQALHNMYEFFREAKQEEVFFTKVRFFSAVATSRGILIRTHRAAEIASTEEGLEYSRIEPDYPLTFQYNEFERAYGNDFTRRKVVDIFENIIHGYGSVLFDLLHKAAEKVAQTFRENSSLLNKRDEKYYRHNQVWQYTRGNSTTTSQAGDSFREDASQARGLKRKSAA